VYEIDGAGNVLWKFDTATQPFDALVVGKDRVLVRQRAMKGLLAGMTEFPSSQWKEAKARFEPPFDAEWNRLHTTIEHTFTHFHLQLTVWQTTIKQPQLQGHFVGIDQLRDEALPSVMRKVAVAALKV